MLHELNILSDSFILKTLAILISAICFLIAIAFYFMAIKNDYEKISSDRRSSKEKINDFMDKIDPVDLTKIQGFSDN